MAKTRAAASHEEQIAWRCVEDARAMLGTGWNHVSDDVRWGLVAANILSVVVGQYAFADEDVTRDALASVALYAHELWRVGMAIKDSGWKRPWGPS